MAQLMLINPAKRPGKRRRKATRSPAQKAATRRMLAANRRTRHAAPKRRRNPIAASAVHRVTRRTRRARSRNPIGMTGIMSGITDAAIGAGGALAVDMAFNYLPLPANMKTGMVGVAAKAATAIALGTVGRKVLGRTAGKMAAGALTVIAYDALKGFVPGAASPVAGLGYFNPGLPAGYLPQQGMGEYINSSNMAGVSEYIYR
jgi:hypothetical protein